MATIFPPRRFLTLLQFVQDGAAYFDILEITYTRGACMADCAQRIALAKCSCLLPVDQRLVKPEYKSMNICKPAGLKSCVYPALENQVQALRNCSRWCQVPCHSWEYQLQSSSATFPTGIFQHFANSESNGDQNTRISTENRYGIAFAFFKKILTTTSNCRMKSPLSKP